MLVYFCSCRLGKCTKTLGPLYKPKKWMVVRLKQCHFSLWKADIWWYMQGFHPASQCVTEKERLSWMSHFLRIYPTIQPLFHCIILYCIRGREGFFFSSLILICDLIRSWEAKCSLWEDAHEMFFCALNYKIPKSDANEMFIIQRRTRPSFEMSDQRPRCLSVMCFADQSDMMRDWGVCRSITSSCYASTWYTVHWHSELFLYTLQASDAVR